MYFICLELKMEGAEANVRGGRGSLGPFRPHMLLPHLIIKLRGMTVSECCACCFPWIREDGRPYRKTRHY